MGLIGRDNNDSLIGGFLSASSIPYDNSSSGLSSTDVQGAIDELAVGSGGSNLLTKNITPALNNYTPDIQDGLLKCDTTAGDIYIDLPSVSAFNRSEELVIIMTAGTNKVYINAATNDYLGKTYTQVIMDERFDYVKLYPDTIHNWLVEGTSVNYS